MGKLTTEQVVMSLEDHGQLLELYTVVSKKLEDLVNRRERKLNLLSRKIPGTKLWKRKNLGMQNNKQLLQEF